MFDCFVPESFSVEFEVEDFLNIFILIKFKTIVPIPLEYLFYIMKEH